MSNNNFARMFQFANYNMFPDPDRKFHGSYKCYSVSMLPGNQRQDIENGGKIILPASALDALTRFNVEYPMLFKLKNLKKNRITHAGVLEFIADEGRVYLPYWMMRNLQLDEGDLIDVNSVSLPVVTYSKFQPQTSDFLDITNPKAVLENALRNFACLTTGDFIAINYNSKIYELCVLETKPGSAVSCIECDMNVDFEAPVGYKHPESKQSEAEATVEPMSVESDDDGSMFKGKGVRLDGKRKKDSQIAATSAVKKVQPRGIPDYFSPYGLIPFDRTVVPISDRKITEENVENHVDPFQGQGSSLKKSKK